MGFDLYTKFIEPMYGDNPELVQSVTSLIRQLQINGIDFCIAGDLPFSLYCSEQMTTVLEFFIPEKHWTQLAVNLSLSPEKNIYCIKKQIIPFGDRKESFPFILNLIMLSQNQWNKLSVEPILSAFKIKELPIVTEQSLIPMVKILKTKRRFTPSEDSFFLARLKQAAEVKETGEVDRGYRLSWAELQALKKKRAQHLMK